MPDWHYLAKFVEWAGINEALIGWLSVLSMITFFGTLFLIPMMVIRMPEDYFILDKQHLKEYRRQHPLVRFFSLILKNILGVIFIVVGAVMLFFPGQGILTMLIGLTLVDFPRKRSLELSLVRKKTVHNAINWMRSKAHKPPIMIPHHEELP